MRQVIAWTAIQLDAGLLLARDDPDAVVLDFMQPLVTARRSWCGRRETGRDETGGDGPE
jgi:hypothetical protein